MPEPAARCRLTDMLPPGRSEFFRTQHADVRQEQNHRVVGVVLVAKTARYFLGNSGIADDFDANIAAGGPAGIADPAAAAATRISNGVAAGTELDQFLAQRGFECGFGNDGQQFSCLLVHRSAHPTV